MYFHPVLEGIIAVDIEFPERVLQQLTAER